MSVSPRSNQQRSEVTKALIIKSAIRSFSESGFTGCNMQELAKEAGFSYQLILYHFETKENLWKAAFQQVLEDTLSNVDNEFRELEKLSPARQLSAFKKTIYKYFENNLKYPQFRKMVSQEMMANSHLYHSVMKPILTGFVNTYLKSVESLIATGLIKKYSADEVAFIITSFATCDIHMKDEYEGFSKLKISSKKFLEKQTNLVMKILFS